MSFFLEQKYGFSLCLELRNFRRDSKRFEENRQQNDGSRSKRIASYCISFIFFQYSVDDAIYLFLLHMKGASLAYQLACSDVDRLAVRIYVNELMVQSCASTQTSTMLHRRLCFHEQLFYMRDATRTPFCWLF